MSIKYSIVSAEVVVEDNYGEYSRFTVYGSDVEAMQRALTAVERAEQRLFKTADILRFG
jgi:hypothetical protein